MFTVLLAVIYMGFVSLGLPDALFGASWPVLQPTLDVPVSFGGIVTMTVSLGTIVSSLLSDRLTSRFGAGTVTAVSVGTTAVALFGFSLCSEYYMLVLCAVPLGLGAGAVDAALNNFVALHFSSRHMNWLHCFWGVGASISPYIMSFWLNRNSQWAMGYRTVGMIQIILTVLLVVSLPLWRRISDESNGEDKSIGNRTKPKKITEIFRIAGVKSVLFSFLAFCAVEATAFAWTSSYLVVGRGLSSVDGARYASLFYIGMTVSRLITGFFADKLGDKKLIRFGCAIASLGMVIMLLPFETHVVCLAGIFIAGFGTGPVYPAVIHSTPTNFGRENSQAVIGVQMAFAYTGSSLAPLLFGVLADVISMKSFPLYLLIFQFLGTVLTERVHRINVK